MKIGDITISSMRILIELLPSGGKAAAVVQVTAVDLSLIQPHTPLPPADHQKCAGLPAFSTRVPVKKLTTGADNPSCQMRNHRTSQSSKCNGFVSWKRA
jgi:hypothetical protein